MTWMDILLILIIGSSAISGITGGFARVGIGTAATLVGIFAGLWCYGIAAAYVLDYVSSRALANLIGFLLIYIGVVVAGGLLGRLLASAFKWIGLSWFDRLLGGAFGVVRGLIIAVALTTVLMAFAPNPPPRSIVESRMMPYVLDASNVLSYLTPHEIKDAFRETQEKVRRIWQEQIHQRPAKARRDEA